MSESKRLPTRLHHYAMVVRDHEPMRHLMEDILGFPLIATWAERTLLHDVGEVHEYCHAFYGLDDGAALAFFQFADPKMYERCTTASPPEIGRFHHVALRVDHQRLDELKQRLETAGMPARVRDHGYCVSLYTNTDEGLYLEFAADPSNINEIGAERQADAHAVLKRWLEGDHTPNNDIRH